MAAEQRDNAPYTLHGRRTEHEAEVRIGIYDNLYDAKEDADEAVNVYAWRQAMVRDKNDQTVHVASKKDQRRDNDNMDDSPPAA